MQNKINLINEINKEIERIYKNNPDLLFDKALEKARNKVYKKYDIVNGGLNCETTIPKKNRNNY